MSRVCIAILSFNILIATSTSVCRAQGPWAPVKRQPARVAQRDVTPIGSSPRTSQLDGQLLRDSGQVWREYDIRSFTRRLRDQDRPEQDVVDWIIRETGTDTWFGRTMSVLNATPDTVRVYHTPRVQKVVKEVVDRFINTRPEANEVAVRLVTVDHPDWRVRATSMLEPVPAQTPGIEAWLISRENAALLLHELSQRSDYREHSSPNLTIYNGQTHLINSTRPRVFQAVPRGQAMHTSTGTVKEGFSLQISPLVNIDGRSIEAVVKCKVDQVERFEALSVNNVDQYGMLSRSQVQVPQLSSWQIHERFRWPTNEVLLISRGRVATPGPSLPKNPLIRLFDNGAPRAEALLFLESRSEIKSATSRPAAAMASRPDGAHYHGRY